MTTDMISTSLPEKVTVQPPPRKRRRKTASGAHEDCFACRRKGAVCDRKRPYCTPCIQIGKECPGYKTTLTWNVGVASRGKLRGLTCPVTFKNTDGSDAATSSSTTSEGTHRRKSSSASNKASGTTSNPKPVPRKPSKILAEEASALGATSSASYQPTFSGPTSAPTNSYQPSLPTIHARQEGWYIPGYQHDSHHHDSLQHSAPVRPAILRHPSLQMIHTALGSQFDSHGHPQSASSVGSYTEKEFHSPVDYPQTPGSVTYNEPFSAATPMSFSHHSMGSSIDSYAEPLSSSIDSLGSAFPSYQDERTVDASLAEMQMYQPGAMGDEEFLFSPGYEMAMTMDSLDRLDSHHVEEEPTQDQKSLTLLDPRFSTPFFHLSPRLQSLMEYYDRHVCPYLVAFDGPENPYRKHILQLAMHNEGLQNAVAALATNNLRMRKQQPSQQPGFIKELTDAFHGSTESHTSEPSAEETCYKQMSIDQLNMQLTDNRAAQDDGVLATLLILCLFHVCDSGFSKFKTQLAGVQKLLSLRHPSGQSDFTRWVEMFFIWFDVMTSAVNDREMQIKPETLDMLDYSANLGALEQFSGCDGRLFKLIARLGRLNLLAQGRPVRPQDRSVPIPSSPLKRKSTHYDHVAYPKLSLPRSLCATDYEHLDGNGWGTPKTPSYYDDRSSSSPPNSNNRSEFWAEYTDIRSRLESWQPSTTPTDPSQVSSDRETDQIDLYHINSAFRSSALLYISRLAYPHLPSMSSTFQCHVSIALQHITALAPTSCVNKFLLWPLFIIGTECVDEGDRNIIRSRCWEVARESGFYNNLSSLEVLEEVWKEGGGNNADVQDEIQARRCDSHGQPFRWRRAMRRVDGEYIVI